jgi:hypothetical protein
MSHGSSKTRAIQLPYGMLGRCTQHVPTGCGEQGPMCPEVLWGTEGPPQQGLGCALDQLGVAVVQLCRRRCTACGGAISKVGGIAGGVRGRSRVGALIKCSMHVARVRCCRVEPKSVRFVGL